MLLHKIVYIELTDNELAIIAKIKNLKSDIDVLCNDLVEALYEGNIDVNTTQDIMFYSGIADTVGKITVNKCVKNTYKTKIKKYGTNKIIRK